MGAADAARAAGVAKTAADSAVFAVETATAAAVPSMCFRHRQEVFAQNHFPGVEAGSHVHCNKVEM